MSTQDEAVIEAPPLTNADSAYLLWQTAMKAHGVEWAWRRLGVRPAASPPPPGADTSERQP